MNLDDFSPLFKAALAHREPYLKDERLQPWFQGIAYPPVLGFGLPRDQEDVSLVTIGLNPSWREIGKHLPATDQVEQQWHAQQNYFENPYESWFDKAAAIVKAATHDQASYGGKYAQSSAAKSKCVHLDLSPLPTKGPFDTVFGKIGKETSEQASCALEVLESGFQTVLIPLLSLFQREHGTKSALLFGYCPPRWGSEVMKSFWRDQGRFTVTEAGITGGIHWAKGKWRLDDGIVFTVAFLSKGPSSRGTLDDLEEAAGKLRLTL